MFHESAMIRSTFVKNIWVVLLPALLTGFLAFQIFRCRGILNRRNSYLLENLPVCTDWVWNALSGNIYPHLYAQDDQPGGRFANQLGPYDPSDAETHKHGFEDLKAKWLPDKKYHEDFRYSTLIPGLPSLTVHYIWCVDGYFTLSQYITILSALHQFRPDKIIIHYLVKPRSDPQGYWRWLEDLERNIVFLTLKPLKNPRHCGHETSAGIVVDEDFPDAHGVFMLGDVAITNLTRPDITRLMAESFLGKTSDKVQILDLVNDKWSQSQLFIVSNAESFHVSQSPGRVVLGCPTVSDFNNAKNLVDASCVGMQSYFHHDEMLRMDTRFFRYARTLLYGSPKPIHTQTVQGASIPNIFHIILEEAEPTITPLLYISIKSAYLNGKIDTVYIHCQTPPRGQLWDRLLYTDNLYPKFVPTGSFLQSGVRYAPLTYLLYTLLQHGGVASFGDIVFVKPLSSSFRSTAAIASLHRSRYRQKHKTLNTAVLASKPGSEFIHEMLSMMHQSGNPLPDLNPDDVASHLSESNALSVFVNSQLMSHQECYGDKCQVAGGHDLPQMVYTTRLIWKSNEPENLEELSAVQGPFKSEMFKLIK